ncbi:MAG: hypothetical protein ACRD7E_19380, partial [Bryobacteraceae bacterium]
VDLWQSLAEAQEEAKLFADAAKSWTAAEHASDLPADREKIQQARLAIEQKRRDQEREAREEARRQAEQELQDLKNKALAEIRAAETRANQGKPSIDASTLEEYREKETKNPKLTGMLVQVDCIGERARLHVQSGSGAPMKLLLRDAAKIAAGAGGQTRFTCGTQEPPRKVIIEYVPKADRKLGVSGDVRVIEFR